MTKPIAPHNSRPTMRDVAALAGVGIKTVSRVVNNEPNVSKTTAERVRQAADELNYRPDRFAGNLRRLDRSTQAIGLLLADASDPFEAVMQRAIESEIETRDMVMFTMSLDENENRQMRAVEEMLDRRVDGLIIMPVASSEGHLVRYQDAGLPVVFIDRSAKGASADTILTNNREASALAAEQFVSLGHRYLGVVGRSSTIETERDRKAGFLDGAERACEDIVDVAVEMGADDEELVEAAVRRLLSKEQPVTAIFATQNSVTVAVIGALHRMGLQHQVALIGFDDFPLADLVEPGITVLRQDPAAIGRLAAIRLLDRIDGEDGASRLDIVPSRLVRRGSGEIPGPAHKRA